jgi:hypothetical protein
MQSLTKAYRDALSSIRVPQGKQLEFLQAHFNSPGKASTAAELARAVGYENWRPINLHYGKLAAMIGAAAGVPNPGIGLLVKVVGPKTISNENWILVMRPEFAKALVQAGWIRDGRD